MLNSPTVYLIYWGKSWSTTQGKADVTNLTNDVNSLVSSKYWTALQEYGSDVLDMVRHYLAQQTRRVLDSGDIVQSSGAASLPTACRAATSRMKRSCGNTCGAYLDAKP